MILKVAVTKLVFVSAMDKTFIADDDDDDERHWMMDDDDDEIHWMMDDDDSPKAVSHFQRTVVACHVFILRMTET